MNNLTLEQAQMLDKILKIHIEHKESKVKIGRRYDFVLYDIVERLSIKEELAILLLKTIIETNFQNLRIVSYDIPANQSIEDAFFRPNENTCRFIDAGGFEKMFFDQHENSKKEDLKKELEIENLKIGPRQYRLNKLFFILNIIFTFITVVLTILIGTGIIGKDK